MSGEEICRALDAMVASGAELYEVQEEAVRLLHESDPRFHWTGIYELFPDQMLRLGPFLGAPTDHVFIAVGRGVCGTAVAERRNLNIPDVRQVSNYLACSSETRSELVVLVRLGEAIYAQIDIDSHELNAFTPPAVQRVQAVADWLAREYQRGQSQVREA
ncbi:MAG TPA: GAF domain-containing protein [Candidatus Saccharimonadales bacterium]|nr:GAF domain-containing protein [Candidatus Saccharimonadales bacterium]